MAFQNKKTADAVAEEVKVPEKKASAGGEVLPLGQEKEKRPEGYSEKREASQEEKLVSAELRKEIEMMELDDKTKGEAEKKAEKIEFLGEKEKIKHLLEIARKKGLVFAIQVARRMNEPYLLDILHDTLAQEGYYKDFINKK
jgi:hypothetical protein